MHLCFSRVGDLTIRRSIVSLVFSAPLTGQGEMISDGDFASLWLPTVRSHQRNSLFVAPLTMVCTEVFYPPLRVLVPGTARRNRSGVASR
jgi:hypothetical protein